MMQFEEIYALARDAFDGGQKGFQLQLLPFRMTADNLYKYRHNPNISFWKNLKEGSDHFEVTAQEPLIAVCSYRYVFNQVPFTPNARFEPTGMCPPAAMPASIQQALAARVQAEAPVMAKLDDKDGKKEKSVIASLLGERRAGAEIRYARKNYGRPALVLAGSSVIITRRGRWRHGRTAPHCRLFRPGNRAAARKRRRCALLCSKG